MYSKLLFVLESLGKEEFSQGLVAELGDVLAISVDLASCDHGIHSGQGWDGLEAASSASESQTAIIV